MQFNNQSFSLTYRGISYSGTPAALKTVPTETTVCYRGSTYKLRRFHLPRLLKPRLTYRGVAYGVQPLAGEQLVPTYSFADIPGK